MLNKIQLIEKIVCRVVIGIVPGYLRVNLMIDKVVEEVAFRATRTPFAYENVHDSGEVFKVGCLSDKE